METLTWLDWLIFFCYLGVVFGLGLVFMRAQRSNEDYFVGGRKMQYAAVGVSLFATAFSSISFVALPREGAYSDYHLLVTYLFIPLVITPVLWWIFVPLYLRLGVTSVYEYLEIRFNRPMRRLGTLLFAMYAIGWMGSMVYATGLILKAVLGLGQTQFAWTLVAVGLFATLYTTLGGIRAVIWTDVLQAVTLGGGVLVVLVLALGRIDGGVATVIELGIENHKFDMFNMKFDLSVPHTFFAACCLGLFMYLPGYTTSQVTVQRYLCMSSLREARRALLINACVATFVAVLFFFMGSTLYAFYHQPGAAGFPPLETGDQGQILPLFVMRQLPYVGLSGLLLAGLFAAVMSTIDSGINSLTAVIVYDWLSGRTLPVAVSRVLCLVFGLAVIGATFLVPFLGEHVIDIIMTIAGWFLGLLMGVFLLGMLCPRANAAGATIGLIAGVVTVSQVWLHTAIHAWWLGAFTCLPTLFVGIVASLFFPPPRPDQLRGCIVVRAD